MLKGRIYLNNPNHDYLEVSYHLFDSSATSWWGEFTVEIKDKLEDNTNYWIQFADNSVGVCTVTKQVNKSLSGILPMYSYRFRGTGPTYR